MMCPYLKYEDTRWFSWNRYCTVPGIKIGDRHYKVKVENVCQCDNFFNCPIYKSR